MPALKAPAKPILTLKRSFAAPPATVYAAWTNPEHLKHWFGPEEVHVTRAEADARVGGRFRVVMRHVDGEDHDVSGVYREVVPNEKLVFTWAWHSTPDRESLVTITFKPDGDGTAMTFVHENFFDEAARDRHRAGWTGCLAKLERFLAD